MLIQTLSFLQVQWTALCNTFNACRRKYVVPLALQGGRDMALLRSGGWVDASPFIPEMVIKSRYVAEEHRIRTPGDDTPYFHRCPYLSISDAEHDMTDFFTGLKLSHDYMPSDSEFMILYAHQTQRFPVGPIEILLRDLSEITLGESFERLTPGSPTAASAEEEEEEEEEEEQVVDRSVSPVSSVSSVDEDNNDQKKMNEDEEKEAPASPVEEDHTGLIQSIHLVEGEGEGGGPSIPRVESNESITSTVSEPICGSSFDYVK